MIPKRVMAGACLMALLVALDAAASARDVTECILVSKVAFAKGPGALPTEIERNQWWVTSGHQLTPGSLNVLLIRRFSEDPGFADSQRFTKITAVINHAGWLTDGRARLEGARFSDGWSGYAYKADAWMTGNATLNLTATRGSNLLSVTGEIRARNPFRRSEQVFPINLTCELQTISLSGLTPWQGGQGSLERAFYP